MFEDKRGRIEDLIVGPIDAVTRITTAEGAVRGNHYHQHTTQWTYVLTGKLLIKDPFSETTVKAGEMVEHPPGVPHAWRALEDTDCLVFTRGPRSGGNYDQDTYQLNEPLL
jgi:quercetin dioxygenase-like cupin family protein